MAGLDENLLEEGVSRLRQASVPGFSNYPTPAQAAVYIGEYYVDDIYSIEWEMSDSTAALHTYFDDEWVTAVSGKKIVSGNLSINFRYPGYLAYAIKAVKKNVSLNAQAEIQAAKRGGDDYLREYLKVMTTGTVDDRVRALRDAASKGVETLRKVSALGLLTTSPVRSGPGANAKVTYEDVFEEQNPWTNRIMPVDVWVHYGDLDTTHAVDIIKGVVFVGKAKAVHAGAVGTAGAAGGVSASGMNLFEVYSFFAKGVEQVVLPAKSS